MNSTVAKLWSFVPKDFLKATIMAGLTVGLKMLYDLISTGVFPTDAASWKNIAMAAGGAAIAYLLKNFMTNSNDQFMKAEPKA